MERKMMKFGDAELLPLRPSVRALFCHFGYRHHDDAFAGPVIFSLRQKRDTFDHHAMRLYAPVYHSMYNATNHHPSL